MLNLTNRVRKLLLLLSLELLIFSLCFPIAQAKALLNNWSDASENKKVAVQTQLNTKITTSSGERNLNTETINVVKSTDFIKDLSNAKIKQKDGKKIISGTIPLASMNDNIKSIDNLKVEFELGKDNKIENISIKNSSKTDAIVSNIVNTKASNKLSEKEDKDNVEKNKIINDKSINAEAISESTIKFKVKPLNEIDKIDNNAKEDNIDVIKDTLVNLDKLKEIKLGDKVINLGKTPVDKNAKIVGNIYSSNNNVFYVEKDNKNIVGIETQDINNIKILNADGLENIIKSLGNPNIETPNSKLWEFTNNKEKITITISNSKISVRLESISKYKK